MININSADIQELENRHKSIMSADSDTSRASRKTLNWCSFKGSLESFIQTVGLLNILRRPKGMKQHGVSNSFKSGENYLSTTG